jgi:hypothetical protein
VVADSELLSTESVEGWLLERGLLEKPGQTIARELEWGVSNVVLAVEADGFRAVVKQALPRLRVADEWLADPGRSLTEAEALRLAAGLAPGSVPAVLHADPKTCAIAIEAAPAGWRNWKQLLLSGEADAGVASRVGELLRIWQVGTLRDPDLMGSFGDTTVFDQLRVDAYHRTVMRRWPALSRAVGARAEELLATRACLVHGDFSPKNVLVGEGGLWVIDFEVAHVGSPAFDPAFMLNHLMLKALHRPASAPGYRACARAFLDAYEDDLPWELRPHPPDLASHVGCLMLARVDGKSPAEYLTEPERLVARGLGTRLVTDPPDTMDGAWERLDRAVAG